MRVKQREKIEKQGARKLKVDSQDSLRNKF